MTIECLTLSLMRLVGTERSQCVAQNQHSGFLRNRYCPGCWSMYAAAAAAKSLQSCPTLCDPMDCSPPGSWSLGFSRQEWSMYTQVLSKKRRSPIWGHYSIETRHYLLLFILEWLTPSFSSQKCQNSKVVQKVMWLPSDIKIKLTK